MAEDTVTPVMSRAQPAADAVFLRKASGLIKTAGGIDVLFFNLGLVSVGIAVALTQLYGPAFYAGGSLWGSVALSVLMMVPICLTFAFLTMTYPRSGGFYVYVSRMFGPLVGLAFSFVESGISTFYGALAATYVTTMGIAPLLTILGTVSGSSTLVTWGNNLSGKWGVFLCGTVVIVLGGSLLVSGMHRYFTVQRVLFTLALGGTVVTIILLIAYTRQSFVHHFNAYMSAQVGPNAYNREIAEAKAKGWTNPGFDFGQTVKLIAWPLLALLGCVQSIGIGGEIKNVNRNQLIGILGALLVAGVLMVVIAILSLNAFGYDFMGAIGYNTLNGDARFSPAITPFFPFLASLQTYAVIWALVITVTFAIWPFYWVPLQVAYVNRSLLAWSLDRMAPDEVGYVSERFHTPVVAILIVMAVIEGYLALFVFTPWLGAVSLIEALCIIWSGAMIGGALLPYRKPDLWAKSPAAHYRVFGVPLITVTGLAAVLGFALILYLLWNDSIAAGHSTPSVLWQLGLFAGGGVLYAVMRFYRRQQGINVTYAFKEIPVE